MYWIEFKTINVFLCYKFNPISVNCAYQGREPSKEGRHVVIVDDLVSVMWHSYWMSGTNQLNIVCFYSVWSSQASKNFSYNHAFWNTSFTNRIKHSLFLHSMIFTGFTNLMILKYKLKWEINLYIYAQLIIDWLTWKVRWMSCPAWFGRWIIFFARTWRNTSITLN